MAARLPRVVIHPIWHLRRMLQYLKRGSGWGTHRSHCLHGNHSPTKSRIPGIHYRSLAPVNLRKTPDSVLTPESRPHLHTRVGQRLVSITAAIHAVELASVAFAQVVFLHRERHVLSSAYELHAFFEITT